MGAWAQRRRRAKAGFEAVSGVETLLRALSGAASGDGNLNSVTPYGAWSWTPTVSGVLNSMQILCKVSGAAGWSAGARLYADSAGLPGALLSSGTLVPSLELPTAYQYVTFSLPPVPVVAGVTYWAVGHMTALVPGGVFAVQVISFAGGKLANSSDGTSWTLLFSDTGVQSNMFGMV